ncbi:aldehyde dehydrogenase (NAD) family protein [Rhodococcus wratislaviensis IFP 2016]|nr:aldehyde dehydrogenase (NAD) family protein [Rhodococcus wratislaviensis IFP 2016]
MPTDTPAKAGQTITVDVDVDADGNLTGPIPDSRENTVLAITAACGIWALTAGAVLLITATAHTIRLSAEEAVRIEGEHVPMDASPVGAGKVGMVLRFPVGVVAAITPFNGPVHLTAHKLGPALAAGNSIVLKPSPKAPLSVHAFIEAVLEADIPDGAVNVLYGDGVAPGLVSDPRVDFVSFTGSIPVGKAIRNNVGMKRVALELGGVGPTFVSDDADLKVAATACARNAMMIAGQSCVSVQNVYVKRTAHDAFLDLLVNEIEAIRFGDPLETSTEVGTLIDDGAAERVMGMIDRAVNDGATLLCGGHRNLLSAAGLDPALSLGQQCGLGALADGTCRRDGPCERRLTPTGGDGVKSHPATAGNRGAEEGGVRQ